jgi:hypothetical protein
MTVLTLAFLAPTEPVSTNRADRMHWAARKRRTDPWRDMAIVATRNALRRDWQGWEPQPVTIQVDLPFRTVRDRDPHNYVGTNVKAVVDGMVRGGLIPNDTPEWATIIEPTISIQTDKARPLLARVTIRPRS